jgi:hypothetical protein
VTADTALRLGKFFKTGAAFWMNMQARFHLETAEDGLAPQIKKIGAHGWWEPGSGREGWGPGAHSMRFLNYCDTGVFSSAVARVPSRIRKRDQDGG